MKLYYISKISDDTYDLSTITRGFEKTITIDELAEVVKIDTVVGFNTLTGKTSIKTEDDVKAYLMSKYKLAGVEPPTFRDCSISDATDDFNNDTKTHRILITDKENNVLGYDSECICSKLYIDYVGILEKLGIIKDFKVCCKTPCKVQLVYDLQSYENMSNLDYIQRPFRLHGVELISIEFVNKDMFKHTDLIDKFFKFVTEFEVSEDFCLDLSELKFKDKFRTYNLLSGNFTNLKLSENFKKGKHDILYSNTIVPRETVLNLLDCDNAELGSRWLTISELRYSDYLKYPNLNKFIGWSTIDTLVLDCNILQDKETKGKPVKKAIRNLRVEPEFEIDIDKEDYDIILNIMNTICYDYSPQLRVESAIRINKIFLVNDMDDIEKEFIFNILKRNVEDLIGTLEDINVLTEQILPEIGKTLLVGEKYRRTVELLSQFETEYSIKVFWNNPNIDDLKVLCFLFHRNQSPQCEFYVTKEKVSK